MERSKFHVKQFALLWGCKWQPASRAAWGEAKQDVAACNHATIMLGVPEVNGNTINEIPLTQNFLGHRHVAMLSE